MATPSRSTSPPQIPSQRTIGASNDEEGETQTQLQPQLQPQPQPHSQPEPEASTSAALPSPPPPKQRQRRGGMEASAAKGAADKSAGRAKRMFGVLNATLGKAKKEAEDRVATDKRRAEILSRQQERLERQSTTLLKEQRLQKTLRHEYEEELRLLEIMMSQEVAFKSMRAQKRRLASFLVTSTSASASTRGRTNNIKDNSDRHGMAISAGPNAVVAPRVPSSLPPTSRLYPVYFLPKKLTLEQEDLLDDQEDEVDALIEEAEKQWEEEKKRLMEQIEDVRVRVKEIKQSGDEMISSDEKREDLGRKSGGVAKGVENHRREGEGENRNRASNSPQDEKMPVDVREVV